MAPNTIPRIDGWTFRHSIADLYNFFIGFKTIMTR